MWNSVKKSGGEKPHLEYHTEYLTVSFKSTILPHIQKKILEFFCVNQDS